jgi:hypothetical protein
MLCKLKLFLLVMSFTLATISLLTSYLSYGWTCKLNLAHLNKRTVSQNGN